MVCPQVAYSVVSATLNSAITKLADKSSSSITWTLYYDYLSDLDDSVSYWRVTPSEVDAGKSLVTYSAAVKLKSKVPAFIINLILKFRLKQATHWVKEQAELRSKTNEEREDKI